VKVDFNRQQATVTALADQYNRAALLKALDKEGYKAKVVKESSGK
jgi:hypothetical protein